MVNGIFKCEMAITKTGTIFVFFSVSVDALQDKQCSSLPLSRIPYGLCMLSIVIFQEINIAV